MQALDARLKSLEKAAGKGEAKGGEAADAQLDDMEKSVSDKNKPATAAAAPAGGE